MRHQRAQHTRTAGFVAGFIETLRHGAMTGAPVTAAGLAGMRVLLLHGDKDGVVPFDPCFGRFVKALAAAGARLESEPMVGAAHGLHWEECVHAALMARVLEFAAGGARAAAEGVSSC